ncbi:MAG: MBL fold metallo-hydrolase [Hungatella sp.]|jgi:7,8-dihydropterin-6-yl-methyl-4-(beta-D-ribofuranosyl)aminobenzene 5'-phosphate synthase|nr:MBL fold metallo-hydrolase [Hungatella sp.]
MVRITALMDNNHSENKALIAEHGLSYLLEWEEHRLLFDCGSGPGFWYNARKLGRKLHHLDAVVLSHSHYDHGAGYRDLIELGGGSPLLCTGPDFFQPKFAFDGVRYTDLSCGFDTGFLAEHGIRHQVITDMTELFPGIFLAAGFPRTHGFETIPKRFVRQTEDGFIPDDFCDEICLVLDTGDSLAVLAGCSHPGILNMIKHIHTRLSKPVSAVFGGVHLVEADGERIKATVDALKQMGLKTLGLSHCSGEPAEQAVCQTPDILGCHLAAGDCIFLG